MVGDAPVMALVFLTPTVRLASGRLLLSQRQAGYAIEHNLSSTSYRSSCSGKVKIPPKAAMLRFHGQVMEDTLHVAC